MDTLVSIYNNIPPGAVNNKRLMDSPDVVTPLLAEINVEVIPKGKTERLSHFPGITPLQAIRHRCLDCSAYIFSEVKNCEHKNCGLWKFRNKSGRPKLKTIKAYCVSCSGSALAANNCCDPICSLYPFRNGKNPNYSEETREIRRIAFMNNSLMGKNGSPIEK